MKKNIQVSRPPSNLAICLCNEALATLGGMGSRLALTVIDKREEGYRIALSTEKGKRGAKISTLESSKWAGRIQFSHENLLKMNINIAQFGPYLTGWSVSSAEPSGIFFDIPATNELDPPVVHHVTKRRYRKSPELDITTEDKWGKLSRVIREFNEILTSPEYKDVLFFAKLSTGSDESLDFVRAEQTIVRRFE